MALREHEFNPKRALAALAYLVRESSNNLYVLMKMLYVADKEHLARTGRFMAGDGYVAMEQGATPSGAYDIAKFIRGDSGAHRGVPEAKKILAILNRTEFRLLGDVPENDLSPVARSCLDEVIETYRQHPSWVYWYRLAHDSAWDESLSETSNAPPISVQAVARAIPDNQELLDYLSDPYPDAAEG